MGFGTHLVRVEKISPTGPSPQKGRFGVAEISTKPILTIFSEKKNFSRIFEVDRGGSLDGQTFLERQLLDKNA